MSFCFCLSFLPFEMFFSVPRSQKDRSSMFSVFLKEKSVSFNQIDRSPRNFYVKLKNVFPIAKFVAPPTATACHALFTGEKLVEKIIVSEIVGRFFFVLLVKFDFDFFSTVLSRRFIDIIIRNCERRTIGTVYLNEKLLLAFRKRIFVRANGEFSAGSGIHCSLAFFLQFF